MNLKLLILCAWIVALAGLVWIFGHRPISEKGPARLGKVPDFEMTSVTANGQSIICQKDLRGRLWVADFIFTRCGGPCPIMSGKMEALQRILPPEVRLVSFTVDPDHDTVPILQDYAMRFHADPSRWLFIRSDQKSLYTLINAGFKLSVEERPTAPAPARVMHSPHFVLIDREGFIRGYYDTNEGTALGRLKGDVQRVLGE